jgi:hypothetical protein
VLSQISCIASGLALLEDEQKLKLGGGGVGAHKTSILSRVSVMVLPAAARRWTLLEEVFIESMANGGVVWPQGEGGLSSPEQRSGRSAQR